VAVVKGQSERGFVLYGTSACHLCEIAHTLLEELRGQREGFEYTVVDISDSEALFERYGVRIPVLRHPDGRELGWPFSADQLAEFVA